MRIFLAPHNDDEVLFGAFTLMRHKPLVIICTDSYIQYERGDGITAEQRRNETIEAMKILGCPVVFLGIPDKDLTEENLEERLKVFGCGEGYSDPHYSEVFAPAIQGGNAHHDIVGKVAKKLFNHRLYTTYTKTELYTTGSFEMKPTLEELELKRKALGCYKSQLNLAATRPHFAAVLDKSEWYA